MNLLQVTPDLSLPDLVDQRTRHAEFFRQVKSRCLAAGNGANQSDQLGSQLGSQTTLRIHRGSHGFKMGRVHAYRDTAQMVDNKTIRDRPYFLFVHRAVSQDLFPPDSELAVAATDVAKGDPARRLVSTIFNTVVIWRDPLTPTARPVARRIHGWFSTAALAKVYCFHRRLLVRGVHGVSGIRFRVTPFYVVLAP